METEFSKEYIEQLLAEIKYYLNPTEEDADSRQFLLGICFGLHAALDDYPDIIQNKQYIDAMNFLALQTIPYRNAKTAH